MTRQEAIDFLKKEIINQSSIADKVELLNNIREQLHEVSPLKNHPSDLVLWINKENIVANTWNPNKVAPPENKLLHTSIIEDGITMPSYTCPVDENKYETIDGFHRTKHIKESDEIMKSTFGYMPVTLARSDRRDINHKMASTIRHNRARGTHSIELMANIVSELTKAGMSDAWILKHIGMDADELLRLKQITGLAELFKSREFTNALDEQEK